MPDMTFVTGAATCSHCNGDLPQTRVSCQWGRVPGGEYDVGDLVVWLTEDGAIVVPFSIRGAKPEVWKWNYGDPTASNVLVLDKHWFEHSLEGKCPACGVEHVALAVWVREGRFSEITYLSKGDYCRAFGSPPEKAVASVLDSDGTYHPRVDWYDHPLDASAVIQGH